MKRSCPFLCFALLVGPLAAAWGDQPPSEGLVKAVKGRVLLDSNGNGKPDDGDKGVADVAVSDGIQFVRTAADGSYSLTFAADPLIPYRPAQVLSVCWPSGTWPVSRKFHVRRGDIKDGQSVDFLLREQKQNLPFTFAHGTDPHDNLACAGGGFGDDIQRMNSAVAFCVLTGDLGYATRDNSDTMFSAIRDATRRFPIPLLHTPGNHDICDIHTEKWTEQNPRAGYGPYAKYLGPLRWSFDHAGVHFVGLDWARITEDRKLETGVPDTVIDWLKKDLGRLKPGTRAFVFMHHHFRHGDTKFWDLLAEHKVELLLAGHSHRNKEENHRGVAWLTTQNLCGPYRLVTVQEKGHAVINRCYAGTGDVHRHSYAGKCKMTPAMSLPLAILEAKKGLHKEIKEQKLSKVEVVEGLLAEQLELVAEVDPGSARRLGIRLGAGKEQMELVIRPAEEELQLGTVRTGAVIARGDRTYRLRLVVTGDKVIVLANNRVQFETPRTKKAACAVELFAEEGTAIFRKVDLWEIKEGGGRQGAVYE